MLTELEAGPAAMTGATEEQLQARKKLAEKLIIEESKHEAVEGEYFWPAVREKLPGGNRWLTRPPSRSRTSRPCWAGSASPAPARPGSRS